LYFLQKYLIIGFIGSHLQNFSFESATFLTCMFRNPKGEKLQSLGKTDRVLQEAIGYKGGKNSLF